MSRPCLDFTSALYLGMHHPRSTLGEFASLTTGVPAALREPPGVGVVNRAVASLVGMDRALVFPSTLHLFSDIFFQAVDSSDLIVWDAGLYPIVQSALESAVARRGLQAICFAHHRPRALARVLLAQPPQRRTWIVTDGFCPGCGHAAPIAAYSKVAQHLAATLLIDDTQAIGIMGAHSSRIAPYGLGGGGTVRLTPPRHTSVVVAASLCKGFGAPLCIVAGTERFIRGLEQASETRVNSSPPSAANLNAAMNALKLNVLRGDRLRRRLAGLVTFFRERANERCIPVAGGIFPAQRCWVGDAENTLRVHRDLMRQGVLAVPQQSRCGPESSLTFFVNADHRHDQIDEALGILSHILANLNVRIPRPVHRTATRGGTP